MSVRAGADRLKENREIYSGLVFLGPEAIKMGLADELGTVESVARDVIGEPVIVDYTEQERLSDRFLKKSVPPSVMERFRPVWISIPVPLH